RWLRALHCVGYLGVRHRPRGGRPPGPSRPVPDASDDGAAHHRTGRGGGATRTMCGAVMDANWSMDVYDTREEAQRNRTYMEVLPLVKITEEVVDYGDWTDLAEGGE